MEQAKSVCACVRVWDGGATWMVGVVKVAIEGKVRYPIWGSSGFDP